MSAYEREEEALIQTCTTGRGTADRVDRRKVGWVQDHRIAEPLGSQAPVSGLR